MLHTHKYLYTHIYYNTDEQIKDLKFGNFRFLGEISLKKWSNRKVFTVEINIHKVNELALTSVYSLKEHVHIHVFYLHICIYTYYIWQRHTPTLVNDHYIANAIYNNGLPYT